MNRIKTFSFVASVCVAAAVLAGCGSHNSRMDHHVAAMPNPTPKMDIVDTAVSTGSFNTLVTAVKQAGLVETLKGPGPFTVFAPTDEAFAKLPKGTLDSLLQNKAQLRAVLLYHVVPGNVSAAEVTKIHSVKTVGGSEVPIRTAHSKVFVGSAKVVKADIAASNGVIHVIDTVLIPPSK